MKRAAYPTQDELASLVHYCQETGTFTRVSGQCAGRSTGFINMHGYVQFRVKGTIYPAHRLAFVYMTGSVPDGDVDHINGNRADNRWANLRAVSRSVNMENQRSPRSNNKIGLLGVVKNRDGFQAQIKVRGKSTALGTFKTAQEAHAAYVAAKRVMHEGNTL